jgi:hypothetical protein
MAGHLADAGGWGLALVGDAMTHQWEEIRKVPVGRREYDCMLVCSCGYATDFISERAAQRWKATYACEVKGIFERSANRIADYERLMKEFGIAAPAA